MAGDCGHPHAHISWPKVSHIVLFFVKGSDRYSTEKKRVGIDDNTLKLDIPKELQLQRKNQNTVQLCSYLEVLGKNHFQDHPSCC